MLSKNQHRTDSENVKSACLLPNISNKRIKLSASQQNIIDLNKQNSAEVVEDIYGTLDSLNKQPYIPYKPLNKQNSHQNRLDQASQKLLAEELKQFMTEFKAVRKRNSKINPEMTRMVKFQGSLQAEQEFIKNLDEFKNYQQKIRYNDQGNAFDDKIFNKLFKRLSNSPDDKTMGDLQEFLNRRQMNSLTELRLSKERLNQVRQDCSYKKNQIAKFEQRLAIQLQRQSLEKFSEKKIKQEPHIQYRTVKVNVMQSQSGTNIKVKRAPSKIIKVIQEDSDDQYLPYEQKAFLSLDEYQQLPQLVQSPELYITSQNSYVFEKERKSLNDSVKLTNFLRKNASESYLSEIVLPNQRYHSRCASLKKYQDQSSTYTHESDNKKAADILIKLCKEEKLEKGHLKRYNCNQIEKSFDTITQVIERLDNQVLNDQVKYQQVADYLKIENSQIDELIRNSVQYLKKPEGKDKQILSVIERYKAAHAANQIKENNIRTNGKRNQTSFINSMHQIFCSANGVGLQ